VKANGGKVRLNTDGHGSLINKRNIAPELHGVVDTVSISLNSVDPRQYGELMRINGEKNHAAMVEFAGEAKKYVLGSCHERCGDGRGGCRESEKVCRRCSWRKVSGEAVLLKGSLRIAFAIFHLVPNVPLRTNTRVRKGETESRV
jgi:hypothetical protein